MNLVIVESPTKARTLTKFLKGKDFIIEASIGHIRDLPKAELGVDTEKHFEPRYVVPTAKKKRVGELRRLAEKADQIILATDPDREGEAIAWHIWQILSAHFKKQKLGDKPMKRIVFHEITKHAVDDAIAHPRDIDMQLVDAQQARRVLDRLVGYKLSPLLWQKLSKRWLSAGRVQSVAVRLVVEREREREKFATEEFWTIDGLFTKTNETNGERITARLVSHDGTPYEKKLTFDLFDGQYTVTKTTISDEQEAKAIITDVADPFTVSAVDKKQVKRNAPAPYTTSTLQQDAGRKLYFSSKKTMQLAQKLYEEGLITYHRTDSVHLSEKFTDAARDYIKRHHGEKYVPKEVKAYKTKSKVAQEAHEAIRPTDVTVTQGAKITRGTDINRDHGRLYELIWKRAVASQAEAAVFDSTTITITSANAYAFQAKGSVVVFDGYLAIAGRDSEDDIIPSVAQGDTVVLSNTSPEQHFTNPPPRYSEARLVKTLEEKDIGRPSTYAPIISTIQDRQYVQKDENKRLVPTDLGDAVTDFLVKYFPSILELPFTAEMEQKLDNIAGGETKWVPVIEEFYAPFEKKLKKTYEEAQKVKVAEEELEEECPDCGNNLVIRMGRYGKFVACTTFPDCKYTRQYAEKVDDVQCPQCGGDIVVKKTRRGKQFYGCSNYPKCTFAAWKKEDIKKPGDTQQQTA